MLESLEIMRKKKPFLIIYVGNNVLESLQINQKKLRPTCNFLYADIRTAEYHKYKNIRGLNPISGLKDAKDPGMRNFSMGASYASYRKPLIINTIQQLKPKKIVIICYLDFNVHFGTVAQLNKYFKNLSYDTELIIALSADFKPTNKNKEFQNVYNTVIKSNSNNIHIIEPDTEMTKDEVLTFVTKSINRELDKIIVKK